MYVQSQCMIQIFNAFGSHPQAICRNALMNAKVQELKRMLVVRELRRNRLEPILNSVAVMCTSAVGDSRTSVDLTSLFRRLWCASMLSIWIGIQTRRNTGNLGSVCGFLTEYRLKRRKFHWVVNIQSLGLEMTSVLPEPYHIVNAIISRGYCGLGFLNNI